MEIEDATPLATIAFTCLETLPRRNVERVPSGTLSSLGRRLGMKDCILARFRFVLDMTSFDGLARYKSFFGHGEV